MSKFVIITPSIGRDTDGLIYYAGPEDACLVAACERCNEAAKARKVPTEEDMALIEALPLLDETMINTSDLLAI